MREDGERDWGTRPLTRRAFLGTTVGSALLGITGDIAGRAGAQTPVRSLGRPGASAPGGEGMVPSGSPVAAPAGAQAASPPPLTVTHPPDATARGNLLLTPFSVSYPSGPLIADSAGNVIWFRPTDGFTTNLRVQSYLGEPVLTWWQGTLILPNGYGTGQGVILDTFYNQVATVSAGNGLQMDLHDFVISPENTALIPAYHQRRADLSSVGGPSRGWILDCILQEVDVPTGRVINYWRASRHVSLDESYMAPPTDPTEPFDFFHLNSIDVDEDGNLLISARHTWCVYKVHRTTGRIIWRLHGKRSDFHMGRGTRFQMQHHAVHHPGGLLSVFDDGTSPTDPRSRGLLLAIDTRRRTVQLVHAYTHHPLVSAKNQGSMQVLPNGNALLGWGSVPLVTEYTSDGRTAYEAQLPSGVSSYRAFRAEFPAPPPASPGP